MSDRRPIDRKQLLPPSILAPLRTLARDFLALSTRDKLLLVAVANRNTPTDAGDMIEATVLQIEATLAKPAADREADLAAVALDVERRLAPFKLLLAQIDPARRATITAWPDGHAEFSPADAATARSTPCRIHPKPYRKKGRGADLYNAGQIVVGPPQGKLQMFDRNAAHGVAGCHSCRRGPGPHCLTCHRIDRDDIRIEKTPHNVRPELTADLAAPANPGADAPQATHLPADVENALRLFLATFASLPPVGIIYLAHRATRCPDTFAHYLRQFVERMALAEVEKASRIRHRYGRATLKNAWLAIVAKNPGFEVFQSWKGHAPGSGRKHRKMTPAERAERAEAAREAKVAADFDGLDVRNGGEIEAPAADRTFDRRDEIEADRDEETTSYFYPDDGTEW